MDATESLTDQFDSGPTLADVQTLSVDVARMCHSAAVGGVRTPRLGRLLEIADETREFADTLLRVRGRGGGDGLALPRALQRWWLRLCGEVAAAVAAGAGMLPAVSEPQSPRGACRFVVDAPSRDAVVGAEAAAVAALLCPPLGHTPFSWRAPAVVAHDYGVPVGHTWESWCGRASLLAAPGRGRSDTLGRVGSDGTAVSRDRTLRAVWALREAEAVPMLQAARSAGAQSAPARARVLRASGHAGTARRRGEVGGRQWDVESRKFCVRIDAGADARICCDGCLVMQQRLSRFHPCLKSRAT